MVPRQLWDVRVPMRDGVELSADIHFPDGDRWGPGPYPVILERHIYNAQLAEIGPNPRTRYTEHGYVVVLQDVRGRNDSDGTCVAIHQEVPDGYDTIEWIATQPWSNGRVGMVGGSYQGWTQLAAAKALPPHLKALWVDVAAGFFGRQEPWNHGIMLLPTIAWSHLTGSRSLQASVSIDWHQVYWHLPLGTMDSALGRDLPTWREWTKHPGLDDYWNEVLLGKEDFAAIDIPMVLATGWFDYNQPTAQFVYEGLAAHSRAGGEQRLLIGPWTHETIGALTEHGGFSFGPTAQLDVTTERLRWFGHWLKDEPAQEQPPIRVFVLAANRWVSPPCWPPASIPRHLYLHSDGTAGEPNRPGELTWIPPREEPADAYRYDPADPVIAMGGSWNFYPYALAELTGEKPDSDPTAGLSDPNERRDVLVFRSAPLEEPLLMVGYPEFELCGSSSAPDTDWFVTLGMQLPDGRHLPLSNGQLRARYRSGLDREDLLVPGEVTTFKIAMRSFAAEAPVGSSLVVTVTSSNFPVSDRNLNTGEPPATATRMQVALNTVYHDAGRPSRLGLPVVSWGDLEFTEEGR